MRKTRPNFPRGKRIEDTLIDSHNAFRKETGTTDKWEKEFDEKFSELKKEMVRLRQIAERYNIHHLKRG